MVSITHKRLFDFIEVSQRWLQKNAKNKDTKLGYAIKRVFDFTAVAVKDYNMAREKIVSEMKSKAEDIDIDLCTTDKDGIVQYDITTDSKGQTVKSFKFTKLNLKDRARKLRNLREEYIGILEAFINTRETMEVFINTYIATEIPSDLVDEEYEALKGICISNDPPSSIASADEETDVDPTVNRPVSIED